MVPVRDKMRNPFKSRDPDIDKAYGRFHLRFHFSLSAMIPNEVVGSYSLL
jgi:hypothetical protein